MSELISSLLSPHCDLPIRAARVEIPHLIDHDRSGEYSADTFLETSPPVFAASENFIETSDRH